MFIDLSGNWKLKLDAEKSGLKNKYFLPEQKDFDKEIKIPGTISQQKLSPETSERATGYLTDPYKFEGYGWYKKIVHLDEIKTDSEYILFLERTRKSQLWIDGIEAGSCDSLNGFHKYNITQFVKQDFEIEILISNVDYPTGGGHLTSPDTQTNWNGICGKVGIIEQNKTHLANIKISTEVNDSEVQLNISADLSESNNEKVCFVIDGLLTETKELSSGNNCISFSFPADSVNLWADTNPSLYNLSVELCSTGEKQTFTFGFRSFTAGKDHFLCNGQKVFLRGKHDGMIFPETGFAPADKESWLKVMKTAREYGINHYRFHTCCPPEAAFEAADELGIYMCPELPFWGTIQAPGEEGFNEIEQNYLISEGFRILDCFGNHPSFVMMSMGNELWGSEKRLDDIMKGFHDYDNRHLYTGGSNNFQFWPRTTEHEDYFSGVRFSKEALIRGSYAMCDAPLGFVQTEEPNTNHNYDVFFEDSTEENITKGTEEIEIQYGTGVKKVKAEASSHFTPGKPCISHEVGQYCNYPDFSEIERYTGVLKPYNFEEFRKRLIDAGMEAQAQNFFRDSSRLQSQCYKTEIEAALRSNKLAGFQLLDIQDFTGQGTAVVGVLNSFMESKGIVSGEQWRSFCDETVLLASFNKYVYCENEELNADLIFHNYSAKSYRNEFVTAYIIDSESDEIICEESFLISSDEKGNQHIGNFKYKFEKISEYKKYALLLILQPEDSDKAILNSYMLHIYPKADSAVYETLKEFQTKITVEYKNIVITKNAETAVELSKKNKKVLLVPEVITEKIPGVTLNIENKPETVEGTYCTDFWCYPMFRSISESMNKPVPTGTLGLTIDTENKLFTEWPTDSYTTPKWYNLISHSTCVNLGKTDDIPVIQMIDNFERNWKLGLLYKKNNLTVCTIRLWEIADKPEAVQFAKSIFNNL